MDGYCISKRKKGGLQKRQRGTQDCENTNSEHHLLRGFWRKVFWAGVSFEDKNLDYLSTTASPVSTVERRPFRPSKSMVRPRARSEHDLDLDHEQRSTVGLFHLAVSVSPSVDPSSPLFLLFFPVVIGGARNPSRTAEVFLCSLKVVYGGRKKREPLTGFAFDRPSDSMASRLCDTD